MVATAAGPTLQAIRYHRGSLEILNQLLLPFESVYEVIKGVEDGHTAIKTMKVRGAPAIAIVAALSLAVELHLETEHRSPASQTLKTPLAVSKFVHKNLEYLKTSRPTAVNLFEAAARLDSITAAAASQATECGEVIAAYMDAAEGMLARDIEDNRNIGRLGAEFLVGMTPGVQLNVLTHCNTGSLATAGWGTALGVIRDLHASGHLSHAYCTETRPYNQGSRLTAYELVYEEIPATLICDSMASALLKQKNIGAIVVGADRVAANGDTANKIGTYQLAITAAYHGVPFLVAAPWTTIDLATASGEDIPIEERSGIEVKQIRGLTVDDEAGVKEGGSEGDSEPVTTTTVQIAARGVGVWNPAFDITPASLITAVITEKGVIVKAPGASTFDLAREWDKVK
ncbi:S-methyl-5-thioribose-1-phosphate isomerase [Borealophlyctis nickersoniae]|nr:S-methyl-5-thioribose-1-phosphate isomerase [Borealophlyctis nickersoniae]